MAISPKLEFRQTQALVMTPQLQQAIKLLQLSNLELGQYVEQELERNPILERADDDDLDAGQGERDGNTAADDAASPEDGINDDGLSGDISATELDGITPPDGSDVADAQGALDTDYENNYASRDADTFEPKNGEQFAENGLGLSSWSGSGGSQDHDGSFSFEQTLGEIPSLKDHLLSQMNVLITDPVDLVIGAHLIESLDGAGYVAEPPAQIADRLGCPAAEVERVLLRLQALEPTGVFARDLAECLALQLRERDRLDPVMERFIGHLDLLAAMDIPGLLAACEADAEDVQDMIAELKTLNPKPGLAYDHDVAAPAVPDVFVREKPGGGWSVELNNDTLPRVLVNRHYYAEVSKRSRSREDRSYLSDCLQSANWLAKSLDQRARTILKVSTELVRQQDAFLAQGVQHLKPLNLKAIAEQVDIHESTVSRVTSNKYMATPRGIFELKYFFTSAISSANGGQDHSSEAVRQRIRELIDEESTAKVLSDDKLVDLLRTSGVDIARRTVAKYREGMGIPSSVQRRRLKRLQA